MMNLEIHHLWVLLALHLLITRSKVRKKVGVQLTQVTVVSPAEATICTCSGKLRVLIWARLNDTRSPSAFIVFAEAARISRLNTACLNQCSRQRDAVSQRFAYRLAVRLAASPKCERHADFGISSGPRSRYPPQWAGRTRLLP
jgi:hypothetical protein